MTPVTVSATAPDAIVAMPGSSVQVPGGRHRGRLARGKVAYRAYPRVAPTARPGGGASPLWSGNPCGNPNPAPRCRAKARMRSACRVPVVKNGHDPVQCRAAGPDAGGAGQGPGPRPVGAFADRRQYPMQRRTEGWWRDRTPESQPAASSRAGGAFANCSQHLMQRRTVGLVAGPNAGQPAGEVASGGRGNPRISVQTFCNVARWGCHQNREQARPATGVASGGRRNSRIPVKTPCNVTLWDWWPGRAPGSRPRRSPWAAGAIRESRSAPYATSCGGAGGRTASEADRPGAWPRAVGAIRKF
jgi:hypothetical protein